MTRSEYYSRAIENLGFGSTIRLELLKRINSSQPMRLTSKHLKHPVQARRGTSDVEVFAQIFTLREYRCLDHLKLSGLIVDLGANVGYSAAYFLSRFPECRVAAVEPYEPNFVEMKRNLLPYSGRVSVFQAAIMPGAARVALSGNVDPGTEWGISVAPASGGDIKTITIPEVMRASGADRIALLKIDIEGAEQQLFEADTGWLESVDNMVIELHGEACSKAFFAKIAAGRFDISTCDELTVCLKPRAHL